MRSCPGPQSGVREVQSRSLQACQKIHLKPEVHNSPCSDSLVTQSLVLQLFELIRSGPQQLPHSHALWLKGLAHQQQIFMPTRPMKECNSFALVMQCLLSSGFLWIEVRIRKTMCSNIQTKRMQQANIISPPLLCFRKALRKSCPPTPHEGRAAAQTVAAPEPSLPSCFSGRPRPDKPPVALE